MSSFIIVGYVRLILGRGAFFCPPYPGAAPKRPNRNRVKGLRKALATFQKNLEKLQRTHEKGLSLTPTPLYYWDRITKRYGKQQ